MIKNEYKIVKNLSLGFTYAETALEFHCSVSNVAKIARLHNVTKTERRKKSRSVSKVNKETGHYLRITSKKGQVSKIPIREWGSGPQHGEFWYKEVGPSPKYVITLNKYKDVTVI